MIHTLQSIDLDNVAPKDKEYACDGDNVIPSLGNHEKVGFNASNEQWGKIGVEIDIEAIVCGPKLDDIDINDVNIWWTVREKYREFFKQSPNILKLVKVAE